MSVQDQRAGGGVEDERAGMSVPHRADPDRLAELEEERRFLLRSLADLDREREAGDVDDDDYATLRDGYTARAATVLRAIEEHTAALPPKPPRRPLRTLAVVMCVLALAGVAGWWVAHSSGRRVDAGTVADDLGADIGTRLARARVALFSNRVADAITEYRTVLDADPDNSEALTYTAWALALGTQGTTVSATARQVALAQATANFQRVIAADPTYADAHCLYAVMSARLVEPPDNAVARAEGEACLANNPPTDMVALVTEFVESLPES